MLTARIDASRAKRKLRAMVDAGPVSRRAAVLEMTRLIIRRGVVTAPRDTNRYANGWAQAGNAAGLGPFPVMPLNRSSKWTQIKYALERQLEYWQRIVVANEKAKRTGRAAAMAKRRRDRALIEYQRFYGSEHVIGIGIYTSDYSGNKPVRALPKVYGGDGRVVNLGDGGGGGGSTVVFLHNKEPHASMVERNTRNMQNAYSAFKGSGLQRCRAAYLKQVLAAMQKAGGGAAVHSVGGASAGGMGLSTV